VTDVREPPVADTPQPPASPGTVSEVLRLAVRLGFTAFGGPAAHIAMLHGEVVTRRKWLTEAAFLDLLGATNLIPGPNSTEMVMHVGYVRAGWRGLLAAGLGFILPAAGMVGVLAWAYVRFGTLAAAEWLLYGLKPVIIAIVVQALWGLGKAALKGPLLTVAGVAVAALYLLGANELALLFGAGLLVMVLRLQPWRPGTHAGRGPAAGPAGAWLPLLPLAGAGWAALSQAAVSLPLLFLLFLKIGSVLYGSGYVLLAFLRNDLVVRLGWLTDRQLLDAVAIGQVTPGPVFTTATFIGYVLGGGWGAVLATVGIFLPSFVFVAAVNPFIPRLRQSRALSALLDGVNAAALGLMAAVTWELGRAALVDALTVALAVIAAVLLLRYKVNATWLVLGGGAFALLWRWLAG
jgi:chromate transporter